MAKLQLFNNGCGTGPNSDVNKMCVCVCARAYARALNPKINDENTQTIVFNDKTDSFHQNNGVLIVYTTILSVLIVYTTIFSVLIVYTTIISVTRFQSNTAKRLDSRHPTDEVIHQSFTDNTKHTWNRQSDSSLQ